MKRQNHNFAQAILLLGALLMAAPTTISAQGRMPQGSTGGSIMQGHRGSSSQAASSNSGRAQVSQSRPSVQARPSMQAQPATQVRRQESQSRPTVQARPAGDRNQFSRFNGNASRQSVTTQSRPTIQARPATDRNQFNSFNGGAVGNKRGGTFLGRPAIDASKFNGTPTTQQSLQPNSTGNTGNRPGSGNNSGNSGFSNRPGGNSRPGSGNHNSGNSGFSNRPGGNSRPNGNDGRGDRGDYDRWRRDRNDRGRNYGYDPGKYDRYRYRNGFRPRRDRFYNYYCHNNWRPVMPPPRMYRPAYVWYYRPAVPRYYRPYYSAPAIVSILGIDFGTLLNASLNYLYYSGYNIDGYYDNVVYLRDVPLLSYDWPDVMMSYDPASGLDYAQFTYSSPYFDTVRYNALYRSLCATYGQPIAYRGDQMRLAWYGGDGRGFVTLNFNLDGGRYYTTLSVGY